MNYLDISQTLLRAWSTTDDIMRLANCGRNSATKIRKKIEMQMIDSGKNVPTSKNILVPTTMVIEYLNLDVDYIFQMAKKQKELSA